MDLGALERRKMYISNDLQIVSLIAEMAPILKIICPTVYKCCKVQKNTIL